MMARMTSAAAAVALLATVRVDGAEAAPATGETNAAPVIFLSPEADAAWADLVKSFRPPDPPPEWAEKRPNSEQLREFRAKTGELSLKVADRIKDFYTKYPQHLKAAEARRQEDRFRKQAALLGSSTAMEQVATSPDAPKGERFAAKFLLMQRKLAEKQSEGVEAFFTEMEAGAHEMIKEFPEQNVPYTWLIQAAQNAAPEKGRVLASEILQSRAPEPLKKSAQALLAKLERVGKPLKLAFTSIDGREIDVQKMAGKVILIDFWATWCGPCREELPNVMRVYQAYHAAGFEIVGISLDREAGALAKFVEEKKMPWPQFLDEEGNYRVEFDIEGIPTMWLVDKKGNLRDTNARGALETRVKALLAEN